MDRPTSRRRVLLTTLLALGAALAVVVSAPAGTAHASWRDTAPVAAATVSTGDLSWGTDRVAGGTWTREGASFDAAADHLLAGQTLVSSVRVPVTVLGDNLRARVGSVGGTEVPAGLAEHVTIDVSAPVLLGSASAADGTQTVDVTLTVTAGDALPAGVRTLDLSGITLELTDDHGWTSTATLDAGTLLVGTDGDTEAPAGGVLELQVVRTQYPEPMHVALYLSGVAAGTVVDWGDGTTTAAVEGRNAHTYGADPWVALVKVVGSFAGIGSPEQTADDVGAISFVLRWDEETGTTDASYAFAHAVKLQNTVAPPSTVTDLSSMFADATSLTSIGGGWQTAKVTSMANMFDGATLYHGDDLAQLDTSSVTTMHAMFRDTLLGHIWLDTWDTSQVTDMSEMFAGAASYVGNGVDRWDTSSVTTTADMFHGATAFNGDVTDWDVGSVTHFNGMFNQATSFDRDLSGWDTSSASVMSFMLYQTRSLTGQPGGRNDLSGWAVSGVGHFQQFADGSGLGADLLPVFVGAASSDAAASADDTAGTVDDADSAGAADDAPVATPQTPAEVPADDESADTPADDEADEPVQETPADDASADTPTGADDSAEPDESAADTPSDGPADRETDTATEPDDRSARPQDAEPTTSADPDDTPSARAPTAPAAAAAA